MARKSDARKRKTRYVPHAAAARFRPTEDWSVDEAQDLFDNARFDIEVDTVYYEDCIAGMEKLPKECVDVVIADPPFGISFDGKASIYNREEALVVEGYKEIEENYYDFSVAWISRVTRVLKKTGSAWVFSGWTNLRDVLNAIEKSGLHLVNHIIWKYQFGVFTKRKFVSSHYHVLFLVKDPRKYYFNKIEHYPLDVWEIKRTYMAGQEKNSTKLPERLVMRCIDFTSRPGDLVLDPFMGNGTTAVVAKATYRHYLGFEINSDLRPFIDRNLERVRIGQYYSPYSSRPDEIVVKARSKFGVDSDCAEGQMPIDSWLE